MSAVTQTMSAGLAAPAADAGAAGAAPRLADPPRLADGTELMGEFRDSGDSAPPSLVRRPDGQVIQMSRLLYQVTSRIDGSRCPEAVADAVSADLGRSLSADQVRLLITAKLLPLGIVTSEAAPVT
ncbi:MAG TPA: hypothetical protein VNH17_21260, partial [Streptosporangiaceae bacterium]|nr:hypothetical protein [Streptosporangiaceae bacterium]